MNISQDNYVYRQIISFDRYHGGGSSSGGSALTGPTGPSGGPTGNLVHKIL